jgi:DNA repair exonuclease SbcCD nuclease subunit
MSKLLLIGDPHGQPNNLIDLGKIFDLAELHAGDVDGTILMGDLFHTHRILQQEVISFYKNNLERIAGTQQDVPVVLVGNHDMVGPTNDSLNAVSLTLEGYCTPVVKATKLFDGVWGVPFIADKEKFIEVCKGIPADAILLCHQTFDGSKYENGFYAPDGLDQKLIPQSFIVSGHIHSHQVIDGVTYIGTPRAVTAGEANQSKFIWILDTETRTFEKYCTDPFVKTYRTLEVDSDTAIHLDGLNFLKDDIRIVVSGTQEFYNNFIDRHQDLIGKAKIIPNIKQVSGKKIDLEKSDSISDALHKYVFEVADINEELKEGVWNKLQQVIPQMLNKSGR